MRELCDCIGCEETAEYSDHMGNILCETHVMQEIAETDAEWYDFERLEE